jgi:hypothetical protein
MRLVLICCGLLGCDQQLQSRTAGQISSIALQLLQPVVTGTPESPINTQSATFNLTAIDDHGLTWPLDVDVDVYISFGGVKTGIVDNCGASNTAPIKTIHLVAGTATNQSVDLPQAYGATTIWLDEHSSHATGSSPTIYFRNPLISDIQTPPDLMAPNATFCTPFNRKFIIIDRATGAGQLVVTSVFGNAFAVTDTGGSIFNSIYLFSFGKPPQYIVPGKVLKSFSGNLAKFVGFSELNFPLFDAADDTVPLAPLPAPVVLTQDHIANRDNVFLLQYDAGVVEVSGKVCDPDPPNPTNDPKIQSTKDQWASYNEFVIDADGTCQSISNFAVQMPGKVLGTFDPLQHRGGAITVVGMLRNNSGQNPYLDGNGNTIACDDVTNPCVQGGCVGGICKKGAFNFWTVNPRSGADITVQ